MIRIKLMLILSVITFYLCTTIPRITWAEVIHVPDDYLTIQGGLNAASTGDTVLVAPGEYHENILWPSINRIKLLSEWNADSTVIDGGNTARVITMSPALDSTTVIYGFTMQNGSSNYGGGIYCEGSSPTIIGNIITSNRAEFHGGGIYCSSNSNPTIENNMIDDNEAVWGEGGGIYCYYESNPTIAENTVANNSAYDVGGGICSWSNSKPIITNNTITANIAWFVGGGGICCWNSSPTIINNTITDNLVYYTTVFGGGGGIFCHEHSNPSIIGNTITNNSAAGYSGGGICCSSRSEPIINFNNIYGNTHYSINNEDTSLVINAEYNWWGHGSGPYHSVGNPDGQGDTVSNYVDYDPWLLCPFYLDQNVPNPFCETGTDIDWAIGMTSDVSLGVFDSDQILVRRLVDERHDIGYYRVHWDGRDEHGVFVENGRYSYTLISIDTMGTDTLYSSTKEMEVYCPPHDTIPPAKISDLRPYEVTSTSATLIWTAPGDDNITGTATIYDIRYSTAPIDTNNWVLADTCLGEPVPQQVGSIDSFTVTGLSPDTKYYFAIKTADEVPNWSGLSNIASNLDAPEIISITDVGNDQGRQIRIKWGRSLNDGGIGSPYVIVLYSIWRRIDEYSTDNSIGNGPLVKGKSRLSPHNELDDWYNILDGLKYPSGDWDFITVVPARGESTYNCVCRTLADSTAGGIYYSVFFVCAHTPDPLVYADSDSDSGYSVDNLPPGKPGGFEGECINNAVVLSWNSNPEADLSHYAIYRDTTSGFQPDASNLLGTVPDTSYTDSMVVHSPIYYYRLSALDFSGNESEYSGEVSVAIVGIKEVISPSVIPKLVTLSQNHPNPFRLSTEINYTLPENSHVSLKIYNRVGQEVKELVNKEQKAGYYKVHWDSRNEANQRVPNSIYFYRLKMGNSNLTRKMLLIS